MSGIPAGVTTPGVQVGLQKRSTNLQVVTRRPLMVDSRQFLPSVEDFLACRNRPPHTTRTGEVLSRLSVEDAASAGWINLALNGLDLLGDIKVSAIEVGDDLVGNALHPLHERISAVQLVALIGVELAYRRAQRGARTVELLSKL